MSRIFEALQQSEFDRSGRPDNSVISVTELLRAAEARTDQHIPETLPASDHIGVPRSSPSQKSSTEEPGQGRTMRSAIVPDSRLISVIMDWSLPSEKFRLLGLRLRQLRQKRSIKTVLVTSTLAAEGKSFVSANLAVTMSRKRQQRVLLIDGDLRRPTLAKTFGLGQLSGFSECLKNGTPILNGICFLEDLGFWFLPAGNETDNSLELMQSGGLSQILKDLSSSFDWIIIDSPPLLPLADTSFLSKIADGTLLVTRQGTTEKRMLQRGVELLDKAAILGVIINSSRIADHQNYYQRYGYGSAPSQQPKAAVTPIA